MVENVPAYARSATWANAARDLEGFHSEFVVVEARSLPIGWAAERRDVMGSFEDPPSVGHRSKRLQFDVGGTEGQCAATTASVSLFERNSCQRATLCTQHS